MKPCLIAKSDILMPFMACHTFQTSSHQFMEHQTDCGKLCQETYGNRSTCHQIKEANSQL